MSNNFRDRNYTDADETDHVVGSQNSQSETNNDIFKKIRDTMPDNFSEDDEDEKDLSSSKSEDLQFQDRKPESTEQTPTSQPIVPKNNSGEDKYKDVPLIFSYFPDIIKDMYLKGINFSINEQGEVVVKDFYRPATFKMNMNEDETFTIETKRENIHIKSLDDLIAFNFKEWKKTGKNKGNFSTPARCWSTLFGEKGLVKREVVFTPVDD